MKFRLGTIDDLAEVQRLNKALFVFEKEHVLHTGMYNLEWPYQPAGVNYFTECLKGERNQALFVAEDEGKLVGYLAAYCRSFAYMHENPIAEIDNMFVEEAHRGTGVGSKLIDEYKRWGTSLGAAHFQVNALTGNPAIEFYKKNGFGDFAVRLTLPAPKGGTHHA